MDEKDNRGGCDDLVEDSGELTLNQKYIKFHKNQYKFPPPSVPSMYWNTSEWVAYIDKEGEWLD